MALTDPVPSSAADVLKRNAQDFDKLLDQVSGTVVTRTGKQLVPWQAAISRYAAYNNRGDWVASRAYQVNDIWKSGTTWYLVLSSYTSAANVAVDIASGNVQVLQFRLATTAEAIAGTAGVVPDAAGVHAAFKQFGLGGDAKLSYDLNSLNESGFYYTSGAETLNIPIPVSGITYHTEVPGGFGSQLYICYGGAIPLNQNRFFFRHKDNDTWEVWHEIRHTGNTTVDSNGFIKAASPIVNLYSDKIEPNGSLEVKDVQFGSACTGVYVLTDCPEFSDNGWYLEQPTDRNGDAYHNVEWYYDADARTLTIQTFERVFNPQTGRFENGNPVDIQEGRFISLRFKEQPKPEEVPES